jgi:DNA-binding beta-propeller fold protein YncE
VIRGENLSRAQMVDHIFSFSRAIKPGDMAVMFFAGHGVSLSGGNYLLPSDIPLPREGEEQRARNLSLGEADIIADIQERKPRVLVMMLDACRDNPFRQPGLTRSIGGEAGLARGREAEGVFSIYSAGFGQTALDTLGPNDNSANSVFTRALVPALARTDVHLADLVIDMREQVTKLAASIGHRQSPAYYDQTQGGRLYLAGRPPTTSPVPTPAPASPPAPIATAPAAPPPAPPSEVPTPTVAALPLATTQAGAPTIAGLLRENWTRKVESKVNAAAISRDGHFVAAGNTSIHIVNADNGQTIRSFAAHAAEISGLAFSPDGTMLASASSSDKSVKIWDSATGRLIRTLDAKPPSYNTVAFSPDGREIAAGSGDGSLTIWDLASGRLVRSFRADRAAVVSLAFSPDGRWIGTGGGDLNVWDRTSGTLVRKLASPDYVIHAVAFSHDSQRLAAGGYQIRRWDVRSGQFVEIRPVAAQTNVDTFAAAPDGRIIVSGGSMHNLVRIWSGQTGMLLQTVDGHTGKIRSVGYSADGRRVMWGDQDGLVRVFTQQ